ncbi:hypothetical protein DKX38_015272 [Salix brachista]|uniref:Endoplasmic reticulum metallopeptidase 1-like C-terminal domain-containing protein n=1 Tax=Salix brachista TaxID=2182728 RepID=A0A5N5L4S3_9ROSI|nr:hypothetical protein DKX38_015272 [Salix brachista]
MIMEVHEMLFCAPKIYFYEFVHPQFGGIGCGDLEEVWVTILNITGPLSSWSFADNILPDPEIVDGGPPSYMLRLSGTTQANWTFWLEASSSDDLRVEVAVVDQVLDDEVERLKGLFPDWADVATYSSFMSSYNF